MDKYYVTNYDISTGVMSVCEREGTIFYHKGLCFGISKGTKEVIVTELYTGLKINCNNYSPRTKMEAINKIDDVFNLVLATLDDEDIIDLRNKFLNLINEAENEKKLDS